MRPVLASALVLVLAAWQPAAAQETRAAQLERQRAEKAQQLQPYEPGTLEKLALSAEEGRLRRIIAPHNGFYVEYGYSYKPTGSGIGFSSGFRHDLFDRRARLDLEAGATFRKYHLLRADFSFPRLFNERLELGAEIMNQRHPQEDFYGLGGGSLREDRTSFLYRATELRGRAVYKPEPWLNVGVRVGRLDTTVGTGRDKRFPSIEARFDDGAAPGLAEQPGFLVTDLFAEMDYRDEPGNARSGGRYLLTLRRHSDRDFDRYSFASTHILLQQFLPVFDKKRVFAFQLGMIGTDPADGSVVPFYFRPTIGGGNTVRSLSDYRFRDRAALWFNAEYRWEAFSALDMALFTDWGTVAPRISDLGAGGMKRAYGIGFRFNSASTVFLRIDLATGGGEGTHVFFKFSKAF